MGHYIFFAGDEENELAEALDSAAWKESLNSITKASFQKSEKDRRCKHLELFFPSTVGIAEELLSELCEEYECAIHCTTVLDLEPRVFMIINGYTM